MSEASEPHGPAGRAGADLLPLLYAELRAAAERQLAREPPGSTLQATALVHEAWLRLAGTQDPGWSGRAHFFGAAAQAMRRILVERARRAGAGPRRRDAESLLADEPATAADGAAEVDLIALDDALTQLARTHPRRARVVEFLYFAGLSQDEAAALLDVSVSTVKSEWRMARAWLYRELARGGAS